MGGRDMGFVLNISENGDYCPSVQCDECGALIEKADEGNYIFELSKEHKERDIVKVLAYVHHNRVSGCHSSWEAKNPAPDNVFRWGWISLTDWIVDLNHNLDAEPLGDL